MGNRSAQRPYDAVLSNPHFDHENYFNIKAGEAVLLAFILPPADAGLTDSSLHRLISVTSTGVYQSVLRTGKTKKVIDRRITLASVATAINRRKTFLYVTDDNHLVVVETLKLTAKCELTCEEPVTAAKMLADGYCVYGTASGKIFVSNPEDGASQQVPCEVTQAVTAFAHCKNLVENVILAGFEASEGKGTIVLFNHVTVSNPFQRGLKYQGLEGACADIVVLDIERVVLAVTKSSPLLHIFDLENCSLLLQLSLAKDTQIHRLLTIGEVTPTGKVRLVAGGPAGLVIGIFHITDSSVNWTQTSRSELKTPTKGSKIQSGALTSLECEDSMRLLIYGDDKGQVWLLTGPSALVDSAGAVSDPQHSDS